MKTSELATKIVDENYENLINLLDLQEMELEYILVEGNALQLGLNEILGGAYFHQLKSNNNIKNLIKLNKDNLIIKIINRNYDEIGHILAHECYHCFQHMIVDKMENNEDIVNLLSKHKLEISRILQWKNDFDKVTTDYNCCKEVDAREYQNRYKTVYSKELDDLIKV